MQNYKELKGWKKAHELTLKVYAESKMFPKEEIYSLTSQLRRCSASVSANIAEGCGKNTNNDFARFLNISLGSANETEYFLLLSKDLKYLTEETHTKLNRDINEVKAMLIPLIAKVRT